MLSWTYYPKIKFLLTNTSPRAANKPPQATSTLLPARKGSLTHSHRPSAEGQRTRGGRAARSPESPQDLQLSPSPLWQALGAVGKGRREEKCWGLAATEARHAKGGHQPHRAGWERALSACWGSGCSSSTLCVSAAAQRRAGGHLQPPTCGWAPGEAAGHLISGPGPQIPKPARGGGEEGGEIPQHHGAGSPPAAAPRLGRPGGGPAAGTYGSAGRL